jgi:hypothetical protein
MSDQLVTVESYQFLPEAEAVRMHLESEGIAAVLADAETVSTEWALGNAIGYIKLRVPQSQADAAQVILKELRSRRLERGQSRESDAIGRCLSCDSPLRTNQTKCEQCGWSYADNEVESDEGQFPGETAAEPDESVMENLRGVKKPLVLMVLLPILIAIAFMAITMLGWIVELVTNREIN